MNRNLLALRDSKRAEARNVFRTSPLIEVYVENEEDIPFWKGIFNLHQLAVKIYPAIKSLKRLERGKSTVLKKAAQAGKFLLLCVDSDYDYLLQNDSKTLHSNPYIFQTYTYSFENHLCNPAEMEMMCIKSILADRIDFDFEGFFIQYSQLIFPLFIYHLSYKKENQLNLFTLSEFHETIAFPEKFKITDLKKQILPQISQKIDQKIAKLRIESPISAEKIALYQAEWADLGLNEANTYQFIQGHFLFDTTIKLLNQICYSFKMEKMKAFEKSVQEKNDAKIRSQQLKALKMKKHEYEQLLTPISLILQLNSIYQDSFLWQKLNADILSYKTP